MRPSIYAGEYESMGHKLNMNFWYWKYLNPFYNGAEKKNTFRLKTPQVAEENEAA